mgnify:CR=1 FL=1
MGGTGEQVRAQHAFHQRLLEIDLADRLGERFPDVGAGHQVFDQQDEAGGEQRDDDEADGVRQLQEAMVDQATKGGKTDQHRNDFEE